MPTKSSHNMMPEISNPSFCGLTKTQRRRATALAVGCPQQARQDASASVRMDGWSPKWMPCAMVDALGPKATGWASSGCLGSTRLLAGLTTLTENAPDIGPILPPSARALPQATHLRTTSGLMVPSNGLPLRSFTHAPGLRCGPPHILSPAVGGCAVRRPRISSIHRSGGRVMKLVLCDFNMSAAALNPLARPGVRPKGSIFFCST